MTVSQSKSSKFLVICYQLAFRAVHAESSYRDETKLKVPTKMKVHCSEGDHSVQDYPCSENRNCV